jgi:pimeloyl-ACP methyl ester carboxylesterase
MDYVSEHDGMADWALMLCNGRPRTWTVFLHGHGSSGDQLFTREDLRQVWLPALENANVGILCPNLRGNAWMSPGAAADLRDLLTRLRKRHGATRIALIGGSMGGASALAFAAMHPRDIDGVIALCPATDMADYWRWLGHNHCGNATLTEIIGAIESHYGSTPDDNPPLFEQRSAVAQHARLNMPILITHGDNDQTIPVSQSRTLVATMKDQPNLHYVELLGGNHDEPLAMLPEMLTSLLAAL